MLPLRRVPGAELMPIELDGKQAEAVAMMTDRDVRVGVLTGGPGRGKTTCLREALRALREDKQAVALCAPTGKAARRMSEACGYPAQTIHRLLGIGVDFDWGATPEPLPFDVVIVDEASMLDTVLGSLLFRAVDPRFTRIFLVGDKDQLPSVGPGYVLGDLIASKLVPVVELTTLHRSAAESWVARNAPRILSGDLEHLETGGSHDFRWVQCERGADATRQALLQMLEEELNHAAEMTGAATLQEAFEGLQVLIPMKKGPVGVEPVNAEVQQLVQGDYIDGPGFGRGEGKGSFYTGDKVLQTKNNYQLQVMNGETGTVTALGAQGKKSMMIRFDDRELSFGAVDAFDLELGYATTIHKSQGSEWPVVVVVCHSAHSRMLSRQLIYTAVTRSRRRVVLVGDEKGLSMTLRNTRVANRTTGLREMLAAEVGR